MNLIEAVAISFNACKDEHRDTEGVVFEIDRWEIFTPTTEEKMKEQKKREEEVVNEDDDIELFKVPPLREDCPVCYITLPPLAYQQYQGEYCFEIVIILLSDI